MSNFFLSVIQKTDLDVDKQSISLRSHTTSELRDFSIIKASSNSKEECEPNILEKPASLVFQRTNTEIRNDSLLKATSYPYNEMQKIGSPVNNTLTEQKVENKQEDIKLLNNDIEDIDDLFMA